MSKYNPGHLLVEVYEQAVEATLTEEEQAAVTALCDAMKKDGRHPRDSRPACLDAMAEDLRSHAEVGLQKRKDAAYAAKGFKWRARILHDGEVVFESPMATKEQHQAHRIGQRYIRNYERSGNFKGQMGFRIG